jgi:hypothetical protein
MFCYFLPQSFNTVCIIRTKQLHVSVLNEHEYLEECMFGSKEFDKCVFLFEYTFHSS